MDNHFDTIIIGGGMAGVSIGYELAEEQSVCLLEMETSLAFHSTGRSAAAFLETYGPAEIQKLTIASRHFLEAPPACFDLPLLTPRPLLQVAEEGRGEAILELHRDVAARVPDVALVTPEEISRLFPPARESHYDLGLFEPGAMELDVHAIHQGYVRGMRQRGAQVVKQARVTAMKRTASGWIVTATDGVDRTARTVVNAAGGWGDQVAELAGAAPAGLIPKRRSVFLVGSESSIPDQPLFYEIDQRFYLRPEGTGYLCSPADETPCPPEDSRADELEIARAIDDINRATTLGIRSVKTSWAGLRTFAPDGNPVIGHDPVVPGFFWFVGQGGYGIQMAPSAAALGAALMTERDVPEDLAALGLNLGRIAPGRR